MKIQRTKGFLFFIQICLLVATLGSIVLMFINFVWQQNEKSSSPIISGVISLILSLTFYFFVHGTSLRSLNKKEIAPSRAKVNKAKAIGLLASYFLIVVGELLFGLATYFKIDDLARIPVILFCCFLWFIALVLMIVPIPYLIKYRPGYFINP